MIRAYANGSRIAVTSTSSIVFVVTSGMWVRYDPRVPDHWARCMRAPFGIITFFTRAIDRPPSDGDLRALVRDRDVHEGVLDRDARDRQDEGLRVVRVVVQLDVDVVRLLRVLPLPVQRVVRRADRDDLDPLADVALGEAVRRAVLEAPRVDPERVPEGLVEEPDPRDPVR